MARVAVIPPLTGNVGATIYVEIRWEAHGSARHPVNFVSRSVAVGWTRVGWPARGNIQSASSPEVRTQFTVERAWHGSSLAESLGHSAAYPLCRSERTLALQILDLWVQNGFQ